MKMLKNWFALLTAAIACAAALCFSLSVATHPAHAASTVTVTPGSFSLAPAGGTASFTLSIGAAQFTATTINVSYSSSGPEFTGPSSVTIPAGQTSAVASATYAAGVSGETASVQAVEATPAPPGQALWAD